MGGYLLWSGMSESTIWWLVVGGLVAIELLTGTFAFYLLMLALGAACGAVAAHADLSATVQFVVAAIVGGGAVLGWYFRQTQGPKELPAEANVNVNLDIGEIVDVNAWNADGTASVHYRGANWTVLRRAGAPALSGRHKVVEVIGNRLLLEKI